MREGESQRACALRAGEPLALFQNGRVLLPFSFFRPPFTPFVPLTRYLPFFLFVRSQREGCDHALLRPRRRPGSSFVHAAVLPCFPVHTLHARVILC